MCVLMTVIQVIKLVQINTRLLMLWKMLRHEKIKLIKLNVVALNVTGIYRISNTVLSVNVQANPPKL